jgi:MFS family permease
MKRFLGPLNGPAGALVLEGLFSRLSFGLISFTLPLFARKLGLSLTEIGVLIALNTAFSLALKPLTGMLADHRGRKRTLLEGIGLRSVVSLALLFATAPWHLYTVRGLHGLSMSLRDPAVHALLAEAGGKKTVASTFAWYQTSKSLAGQLSKALAGVLLTVTAVNFEFVFLIAFALSLFPALVVARYVREPKLPPAASSAHASAPDDAETETVGRDRPALLPYIGLGFLSRGTADMIDAFIPIIAVEHAGLSPAQAGSIYVVAAVVLLVSGPIFGWLADHVSRGLVLSVRAAANAFSSAIYYFVPSLAGFALAKSLDDMGKAAYRPAWGSLMAHVSGFDRRNRARTMSLMTMGEDAGSILAPILAGFLWTGWGLGAVLATRAGLAVLTEFYTAIVTSPRREARRAAPATLALAVERAVEE